jgi:nucleotide-binding universal stress UspA family protein
MSERRVVVGVDGSEHAATALRWAAREAELRDAVLVAVLVWDLFDQHHADGSQRFDPHYDERHADAALDATIKRALGVAGAARVTRRAVCDRPANGLLQSSHDADLLVVGARGLGGFRGLLLGSVSHECLHHADVPIAVVRLPDPPVSRTGRERLVVGIDGSESSVRALDWALAEGNRRSAVVDVVHAWQAPLTYGPLANVFPYDLDGAETPARNLLATTVDEAVARADAVAVERTLLAGRAAPALLETAESADLLVLGRRGLGGFGRLLLGSVADHLARYAPCPVVVVPATYDQP